MADTELTGLWRLEMVKLPLAGIRRKGDETDLFFEFLTDGKAMAHIHGDTFPTGYKVSGRYIIFDRMELAAIRLQMKGNQLCLQSYHGVTLLFKKAESSQPAAK